MSKSPIKLLYLLIIISLFTSFSQACQDYSPISGCLICENSTSSSIQVSHVFNISDNKYACLNTANCALVKNDSCIACLSNYLLDSNNECKQMVGCIAIFQDECISCASTYTLNNGTCVIKNIIYCVQYDTNEVCTKCKYQYMDPQANCSISSKMCNQFDEETWKCIECSNGTQVDSTGIICVEVKDYCLSYSLENGECSYCEEGYLLDDSYNCVYVPELADQAFLTTNSTLSSENICLKRNILFNDATNLCELPPANAETHCSLLSTDSAFCQQCMPRYYPLSDNSIICKQCATAINHCLLCTSSTICTVCQRGYYLLPATLSDGISQCLSCSAYGCLQCVANSLDSSSQSLSVECISCPISATLYKGACYACSSQNSSYSIQASSCQSCSQIQFCRYCSHNTTATGYNIICRWCIDGYYLNTDGECQLISITVVPELSSAMEILSKVAPGIQNSLENNQAKLMASCVKTNGYICECISQNLTSTCGAFAIGDLNVSGLTAFTNANFRKWGNELRMAAEFSTFKSSQVSFTEPLLLDVSNYWNLLSIYTYELIRGQSTNLLLNLKNHIPAMSLVFSQEKSTILTGNGFYYKFTPKGITDTSTDFISTTINTANGWSLVFVWFDRVPQESSLTGHIYVFTDTTSDFNVSVLKNGYLANSQNFTLKTNGVSKLNQIWISDGYLHLDSFSKSDTTVSGYQVFSQAADSTDIYEMERIQYIFYSQSFIYILFFLLLYLIFLPLCSIMDCCKERNQAHRKVVTEEDSGYEKSSSEASVKVVNINYREFFPIYNVANSKRPERLPKLCLLIVNLQHGVTILTLVYFNLPEQFGVAAVALAIPGYLCTVILGYIIGFIFRALPNRFQYLINLVSVGYWILWVLLMRQFIFTDYKYYLLTFAIIFFIVDLIIDALETLLVYFAIRQGEKQTSLFKCLARWLSYRGYYDFGNLAKQLGSEYE